MEANEFFSCPKKVKMDGKRVYPKVLETKTARNSNDHQYFQNMTNAQSLTCQSSYEPWVGNAEKTIFFENYKVPSRRNFSYTCFFLIKFVLCL